MIQTIFKRYEKKYLLSPMQYSFLKKHLDQILQVDTYGLHTICSIYFDTDDYSLIRSSLEKPVYKENCGFAVMVFLKIHRTRFFWS